MSMPRRTRLLVGATLALAVLVAAAFLIAPRLVPAPPVRVGVLLPLTGPDAAAGLGMRNAVRLAVGEVNAKGGVQGRKVELIELDDASQVERAREGARRLMDDPTVVAAVSGFDADAYTAIQSEMRDAKLPNMLVGVSNWDKMRLRGPTEYRIVPFGSAQQKHAAEHAWRTLGARTYAFFTDDTYFGASTVQHFREGVRPMLRDVPAEVVIRRGETEFKEPVELLQARPADYVIFAGRPTEAALLLKKLRAAGIKSTFQSATHHPSEEFIDLAKEDAEGALSTFHGVPPEGSPAGKAFLSAYSDKRYPEPAGIYGIFAYSSAQSLMQALEKSFLTRPSVIGALTNESFETALGTIKYNYFGSNYQTVAIYQVKGGKWVPILVTDQKGQLQPYAAEH